MADPGFGRVLADHLVTARFAGGRWEEPELGPFTDLMISPAASVLHYGQAVFEGLKAFGRPGAAPVLFRPEDHAQRLVSSAERLAMPAVPTSLFVECCAELVRADAAWVPERSGHSLYLRPMLIATEVGLGVRPAEEYLFAVFASPVAPFFGGSEVFGAADAISVTVATDDVRAAPGGTGAAKTSGNYAVSLRAKRDAVAAGFDEVLWLDAAERRWVEELSGMNVVLVEGERLVTPPLGGTILAGVTRSSLLTLASDLGLAVSEEPVALDDWRKGARDGSITEAFACGTAAVVAPIGRVTDASGTWVIGDGSAGARTAALREALVSIQEGRAEDRFGWMQPVE